MNLTVHASILCNIHNELPEYEKFVITCITFQLIFNFLNLPLIKTKTQNAMLLKNIFLKQRATRNLAV